MGDRFEGRCPLRGFCHDDRVPLAGSTNTNEAALIRGFGEESMGVASTLATNLKTGLVN